MNNIQDNCQFYSFLLMLVIMIFLQKSFAAEIDCEVGSKLAKNIYDRIALANSKNNVKASSAHKEDFWDIYKYSSNCNNVKKLANELQRVSKPPALVNETNNTDEILNNIQNACMNASTCTITVTGEGGGRFAGIEIQQIYQTSGVDPNTVTMKWEKVIKQEKNKLPIEDKLPFNKNKIKINDIPQIYQRNQELK